jgi:hypothetical protein
MVVVVVVVMVMVVMAVMLEGGAYCGNCGGKLMTVNNPRLLRVAEMVTCPLFSSRITFCTRELTGLSSMSGFNCLWAVLR